MSRTAREGHSGGAAMGRHRGAGGDRGWRYWLSPLGAGSPVSTREQVLIHMLVAAVILPLTFAAVFYLYPSPALLVWHDTAGFVPPAARPGETVTLHRRFTVLDDETVTISRMLVRDIGEGRTTHEIGAVVQHFSAGDYLQGREFIVPALSPGRWTLYSDFIYRNAIGRKIVLRAPTVALDILP